MTRAEQVIAEALSALPGVTALVECRLKRLSPEDVKKGDTPGRLIIRAVTQSVVQLVLGR